MSKKIDFLDWAIENGYSKIHVNVEVMGMFVEYLNYLSNTKNELVKTDVIKSVCPDCDGTGEVLDIGRFGCQCPNCNGTGQSKN